LEFVQQLNGPLRLLSISVVPGRERGDDS